MPDGESLATFLPLRLLHTETAGIHSGSHFDLNFSLACVHMRERTLCVRVFVCACPEHMHQPIPPDPVQSKTIFIKCTEPSQLRGF